MSSVRKERVVAKVSPQKRIKALIANYKKYTEKYNPQIDFIMDEQDAAVWYIRYKNISGNQDEFEGGEYLAKLYAHDSYPFRPPEIEFLTPNGVFACNTRQICTTISKFHSEDYPAVLGMGGFAIEMSNGLICYDMLKNGIGIKDTSLNQKKTLAEMSKEFNKKHYPELLAKFEELPFNKFHAEIQNSKYNIEIKYMIKKYLNMLG